MSNVVNAIAQDVTINVPSSTDVINVNDDDVTLNVIEQTPTLNFGSGIISLNVESGGLIPGGTTDLTYIAATALSALRAVTLDNQGQVLYANNNTLANAQVLGITVTAATSGFPVLVRAVGVLSDPSWNFTKGSIYLGSNGTLTQTAPTSGLIVVPIARALSQTTIYIDVDQTITTV